MPTSWTSSVPVSSTELVTLDRIRVRSAGQVLARGREPLRARVEADDLRARRATRDLASDHGGAAPDVEDAHARREARRDVAVDPCRRIDLLGEPLRLALVLHEVCGCGHRVLTPGAPARRG